MKRRYTKTKILIRDKECVPTLQVPDRMIWTASSLKCFRKCKRKFFWKYIARISPAHYSAPLLIGKAFHGGLAEWYFYKRAMMERIAATYQKEANRLALKGEGYYDQDDYDKMMTGIATLIGMLQGYGEIYEKERSEWVIPKKNIEARFNVNCGDFDYQGSVDCVPRIGKNWTVVEHKTASKLHDTYLMRIQQDTQVRGYCFGAIHGLKLPVKHVMYDVVKKCKLRRRSGESSRQFDERIMLDYMSRPDFYFMREDLVINGRDLAMFERDLFNTHDEFEWLINNFDGTNPDNWCANDGACYEYFRNCDYMPLCLSGIGLDNAALYNHRSSLHQELEENTDG